MPVIKMSELNMPVKMKMLLDLIKKLSSYLTWDIYVE